MTVQCVESRTTSRHYKRSRAKNSSSRTVHSHCTLLLIHVCVCVCVCVFSDPRALHTHARARARRQNIYVHKDNILYKLIDVIIYLCFDNMMCHFKQHAKTTLSGFPGATRRGKKAKTRENCLHSVDRAYC